MLVRASLGSTALLPSCFVQRYNADSRNVPKGANKATQQRHQTCLPGQRAAPPCTRQAHPAKAHFYQLRCSGVGYMKPITHHHARKPRAWRRSSATAGDVRARSASGSTTKEPGSGAFRAVAAATASAASGGGASAISADGASHALRAASAPLSRSSCAASTSAAVVGTCHVPPCQVNVHRPSADTAWPGARVSPRFPAPQAAARSRPWRPRCAR